MGALTTNEEDRTTPRGLRAALNLSRLAVGFCLGVWLVRLLLDFGQDAYGAILLIGSAGGFYAMLQTLARSSLTPVLARSYHSGPERWQKAYDASLLLCGASAALSVVIYGLLFSVVGFLNLPENLVGGVRWYIVAKAVQSCFGLMYTPVVETYLIRRRIGCYNAAMVLERASDVIAALVVSWLHVSDASVSVAAFGWLSTIASTVSLVLLVAWQRGASPPPWPASFRVDKELAHDVWRSLKGNASLVTAMALYVRLDMVLLNLTGGLAANLVFNLAVQLGGYLRLLADGVSLGVETVAARHSGPEDVARSKLIELTQSTTRQQAILVAPPLVMLAVMANPIMSVWIGGRVSEPEKLVGEICQVLWVLLPGLAAKALTQGWSTILNAVGRLQVYSRVVLACAIVNAVVSCCFIWFVPSIRAIYDIAGLFSLLHVVAHVVAIPILMRKTLGASFRELFSPITRPLIIAVAAGPLLAPSLLVHQWTVLLLAAHSLAFMLAYAVLAFRFALKPSEQELLVELGLRRLRPCVSRSHRDDSTKSPSGLDSRPLP